MSSSTAPKAKATKKTAAAAPVAAPVAAPAPAPVVVAAPVPAPAPVVSHVAPVAAVAAQDDNVNVVAEFNGLVEKVNALRTTLQAVFSDMKKLEKRIPRELKKAQKGRRRRAPVEGEEGKPKKETVFTKPTAISDALCTVLNVPKGTLMSRSEVTTAVCKYAKEHNLMAKQVIKADAPMRKLLSLTEKDELKILNLQRYLKPHYPKAATA